MPVASTYMFEFRNGRMSHELRRVVRSPLKKLPDERVYPRIVQRPNFASNSAFGTSTEHRNT
ncbi:hypothetical protein ACUXS6_003616 [Ralstonia pickettii]